MRYRFRGGTFRKNAAAGRLALALAGVFLAAPLSACGDQPNTSHERASFVRTELVEARDWQATVTLTGEVRALEPSLAPQSTIPVAVPALAHA